MSVHSLRLTKYVSVLLLVFAIGFLQPGLNLEKEETDVLFITLEAANKNHFSCYGYQKDITPNICNLGEDGVIYEQAVSPSGMTAFSLPSMETGGYVFNNGKVTEGRKPSNRDFETIAERLPSYNNYFYSGNSMARTLGRSYLDGFDNISIVNSSDTNNLRNKRPKPGFIVNRTASTDAYSRIHLMATHIPYEPVYEESEDFQSFNHGFTFKENYDQVLKSEDAYVGQIIEGLKEKGEYNNTLIVVTTDHGEMVSDYIGHTKITPEIVNIPLIIKPPQSRKAKSNSKLVSTVDIKPTIEAATKGGKDENPKRNLLSPDYSREFVEIYSGLSDQGVWFGIESKGFLVSKKAGEEPSTHNISKEKRHNVSELKIELSIMEERIQKNLRKQSSAINPNLREKLRNLGYIE